MIDVKIKIGSGQIRAIKKKLGNKKGQLRRVMNGAINATAKKSYTLVTRELKAKMGKAKIKTVKRRTVLVKSTMGRLGAVIKMLPKRLSLIDFGGRQTKSGVSYDIGRGRKKLAHAFIATANNSRQIWHRAPGGGPSGLVGRYPLIRMKGPSVGRVEKKNTWMRLGHLRKTNAELKKQIQSKIDWVLSK